MRCSVANCQPNKVLQFTISRTLVVSLLTDVHIHHLFDALMAPACKRIKNVFQPLKLIRYRQLLVTQFYGALITAKKVSKHVRSTAKMVAVATGRKIAHQSAAALTLSSHIDATQGSVGRAQLTVLLFMEQNLS